MKRWRPLLTVLLCGCMAGEVKQLQESKRKLENDIEGLREKNDKNDERVAELEKSVALALCKPEVTRLISELRSECAGSMKTGNNCNPKAVATAVSKELNIPSDKPSALVRLMARYPHVVYYIPALKKGRAPSPKPLPERVKMLTDPGLLKTTTFILISPLENAKGGGGTDPELVRRRNVTMDALTAEYQVPRERIDFWPYVFKITKADVTDPDDLPQTGDPPNLNQGVWIIRTECLKPEPQPAAPTEPR